MNRKERRRGKPDDVPKHQRQRVARTGDRALTAADASSVYYWPNLNYAHEPVLKAASGYEGKLDCVIQHGMDFEPSRVYPGEANAATSTAWSWSELRDKAWARHKPVIQGCAPMLYLMDSYTPPQHERAGTLFAPMHGTTGVIVEGKNYHYKLARTLADLPQPVIVTLYYQEYRNLDIRRQYEKNGYEVICTVPDVNAPEALTNQLDAFARVKYGASNDIGTNALYATVLGIPYFFHGEVPSWRYSVAPGMDEHFAPTPEARKVWDECAEPFREFSEVVTHARIEMAEYHLGVKRKMGCDDLRSAFEWAASLRWPA